VISWFQRLLSHSTLYRYAAFLKFEYEVPIFIRDNPQQTRVVGLARHVSHVVLQLMIARVVHITNLPPPRSECNPISAYVTNLTPRAGSECNPRARTRSPPPCATLTTASASRRCSCGSPSAVGAVTSREFSCDP
jgi:hypothetical protein